MLKRSSLLKVTDLSGLLLAPPICTCPGVETSSWPELELLRPAGARGKVVAEESLGLLRWK